MNGRTALTTTAISPRFAAAEVPAKMEQRSTFKGVVYSSSGHFRGNLRGSESITDFNDNLLNGCPSFGAGLSGES